MKKTAPYIFFLVVILILLWLGFRWYSAKHQNKLISQQLGEGVTIENLSESELKKALGGVKDYETVPLQQVKPTQSPTQNPTPSADLDLAGNIRYEVDGQKLRLGVIVSTTNQELLPLRVWIKKPDGTDVKPLFVLTEGKGGLVGSAQLEAGLLPLEILVTSGTGAPQNSIVLRGVINSPEKAK